MSDIVNPQDRLKQYMKNEEMPTPINYNNPDFLGGDTPITSHDLRQALIAGYKQALEDVRIHTRYQLNILQTMRITRDADIEVRMIAKDIEKILTIPEEEIE